MLPYNANRAPAATNRRRGMTSRHVAAVFNVEHTVLCASTTVIRVIKLAMHGTDNARRCASDQRTAKILRVV